jgi:hypothetical protein
LPKLIKHLGSVHCKLSLETLDDPLRQWRKGKSEAALEPQRVNCSNKNKNSSLENLMLYKLLDADPNTLIPPMGFFSRQESNRESVVN